MQFNNQVSLILDNRYKDHSYQCAQIQVKINLISR
jgi:hypothetical protein